MIVDNKVPLDYVPAAEGVCATAHTSCYTWISSQQVHLETIKLLRLAKCFKGHSSFTISATHWLGSKLFHVFSWFPPGLRAIFRSGLQIVLPLIVPICLIYLIVKRFMFYVTMYVMCPVKTQTIFAWRSKMTNQAFPSEGPLAIAEILIRGSSG